MDEQRSVVHPRLGRGRLLRTYMGSYLWEVQFDSGRRYRLPSHEFDRDSVAEFAAPGQPFRPAAPVLHDDQFYNRQALEALRVGVVPVQHVEDLTIGLETERLSLERALKRTQEHGGDAVAVIADYGFGKSHFLELTARTALRLNFVVASASLDLVEVPPGKAREIYRALIPSLRYPDHDRRGLRPLLDRALENPAAAAHFTAQRPIEDCPLSMALDALANCPAQQAQDEIVHWLGAQIRPTSTMKVCLKKPPTLYATGEVARQYAYLLTAISALAARLDYSGLAVLIDESEHYSLLRPAQRERADSFFKALIHAAVGPAASRIDVDGIPNHTRADYPTSFSENSHLFFEFASTEGEGRMPIEAWLAPSQIIRLDDRFLKEDIEKFLKMVLRYHSVAYRYGSPPRERYENLLHQASTALSRTLSQHRLNIRELIRLTVTICDLMYVYPDYAPDQIHAELLKGLGIS